MTRIYDQFRATLSARGNKTAVIDNGQPYSASRFAELVENTATTLSKFGLRRGDRLALILPSSALHGALLLAASKLDLTLLSLDPETPSGALPELVEKLAPCALVAMAGSRASDCGVPVLEAVAATGQLGFQQQLERTDGFIPDAAEISYILCTTSGSTGAPKPITLTQRVKLTRARIAAETYGLDASDCILLATPMHHTLAQRLFFLPMILGGCSVILPHFTPESWLDTIAAEKVTFTMAVSTQLSRIASFARADVDGTRDKMASLKAVVASSSALPDQSKREILALCPCDIHEMYGTSETATATDVNLNKDAGKQTSVGRPLPEVELRILSRDFTDQPTGEVGQIAVKTAQIFSGYEGMPSQTGAAMHGDFFLTGDLGYLDSDGFLYFSGREKEIIKTGGTSVFPFDIERAATLHGDVIEACSFGVPDNLMGEVPVLLVTSAAEAKSTRRSLRRMLLKNLANIQQPRYVEVVDAMLRTATGKIDKIGLASDFMERHGLEE